MDNLYPLPKARSQNRIKKMSRSTISPLGKNKDALRLLALRESLGFNQREMAREFGVTHGAIGGWERGDRAIPGPVLRLIAIYEAKKENKGKKER